MKKENNIKNSMFYKSNKKIQGNLWKIYIFSLAIGLLVIAIKGLN